MGTHGPWVHQHPIGGGRGSRLSLPILYLILPLSDANHALRVRGVTPPTDRRWGSRGSHLETPSLGQLRGKLTQNSTNSPLPKFLSKTPLKNKSKVKIRFKFQPFHSDFVRKTSIRVLLKEAGFVAKCLNFQQVKAEHLKPGGFFQDINIPIWKWEEVNMDFLVGLPYTRRQHDSICVIIEKMTKSFHFLSVKVSFLSEDYAKLTIKEIVKSHGVPLSIISDRGVPTIGTNVKLCTAFHPQMDGQAEHTIQTLEDMLRACVIDFKDNWDDYLHLIKFAYNNSYHSIIAMAPFEALYGRRCRSPVGSFEVERLKTAQSWQKSYANIRRRDLEFEIGHWVYLQISPMKVVMRFGKKGKLSPRLHPSFRGLGVDENLSYKEVPIEILDRQVKRLKNKEVASVKVLWRNHLVEGATWEAEVDMKSRPTRQGTIPKDLPKVLEEDTSEGPKSCQMTAPPTDGNPQSVGGPKPHRWGSWVDT
uniref:Integrase core domain containing protein n=1 Tax=Solanum demissum TaxID=50514 RepID=Q6L3Q7_SOLDE|nr:Integrase core domain containing protein [Solanum demissum]